MSEQELVEQFARLNAQARRDGLLSLDDAVIRFRLLAEALRAVVDGQPPDEVRRVLDARARELHTVAETTLRSRIDRGRLTARDAEAIRQRREAEVRLILDGALAVQEGLPDGDLRDRLASDRG